jgi:hypothetical protein
MHDDDGLVGCRRWDWERIIARAELPAGTKLVALMIAMDADGDTGCNAHPSERLLADRTGWTTRAVRTHLERLRAAGLLRRRSRGHSAGRADVYELTIPGPTHGPLPLRLDPDGHRLNRPPVDNSTYRNLHAHLPEPTCNLPEPTCTPTGTYVPPTTLKTIPDHDSPRFNSPELERDDLRNAREPDANPDVVPELIPITGAEPPGDYPTASALLAQLPDLGASWMTLAAQQHPDAPLAELVLAAARLAVTTPDARSA